MARARRRTKSGRFTKRRTASTRRRTYRVRSRRSNPSSRYRKYGPSTRKGQVRKTARRAYVSPRRRANKKGILGTPAVKYALAAGAGAISAHWLDELNFLNPERNGKPALPMGLKGSVLAAVITFAAAQWGLKGNNKQLARAAAIGMLVPSVANAVKKGFAGGPMQLNNGNGGGARAQLVHPRNRHAAARFAAASRNIDNVAA